MRQVENISIRESRANLSHHKQQTENIETEVHNVKSVCGVSPTAKTIDRLGGSTGHLHKVASATRSRFGIAVATRSTDSNTGDNPATDFSLAIERMTAHALELPRLIGAEAVQPAHGADGVARVVATDFERVKRPYGQGSLQLRVPKPPSRIGHEAVRPASLRRLREDVMSPRHAALGAEAYAAGLATMRSVGSDCGAIDLEQDDVERVLVALVAGATLSADRAENVRQLEAALPAIYTALGQAKAELCVDVDSDSDGGAADPTMQHQLDYDRDLLAAQYLASSGGVAQRLDVSTGGAGAGGSWVKADFVGECRRQGLATTGTLAQLRSRLAL